MPLLIALATDDDDAALTASLDVGVAENRPVHATSVELHDDALDLLEHFGAMRRYQLTASVVVVVVTDDPARLGPTLNAAYAQLLTAVLTDRTLGGLVTSVAEAEWSIDIDRTSGSGPSGSGALTLYVEWQRWGDAGPTRAAVREALAAALNANTPQEPSVREALCQGVVDIVRAATGVPTERNAIRAPDLSQAGAIRAIVVDGGQTTAPSSTGLADYTMDVAVELLSALADPTARDAELDAMEEAVRAALRQRDVIAGVPVLSTETAAETLIDETDGSAPSSARTVRVTVQFMTDESDPTALPIAA